MPRSEKIARIHLVKDILKQPGRSIDSLKNHLHILVLQTIAHITIRQCMADSLIYESEGIFMRCKLSVFNAARYRYLPNHQEG